ncbi:unnamed protein product, partial [Prorocentrum cordatum]
GIEKTALPHDVRGAARDFKARGAAQTKIVDVTGRGLALQDPDGYLSRWTFRALQVGLRRAVGHRDFPAPPSTSVARFAEGFPDQSDHLETRGNLAGARLIVALAKRVGCTGSLLYFAMCACLLLDRLIASLSPELLRTAAFADAARRQRRMGRGRGGRDGLPAAICRAAALSRLEGA